MEATTVMKEIGKQRRHKKILHSSITASIHDLEKHGLAPDGFQIKTEEPALEAKDDAQLVKDGGPPAKCSRLPTPQVSP